MPLFEVRTAIPLLLSTIDAMFNTFRQKLRSYNVILSMEYIAAS